MNAAEAPPPPGRQPKKPKTSRGVSRQRAVRVLASAALLVALASALAFHVVWWDVRQEEPFEAGPIVALGGAGGRMEAARDLVADRPDDRELILSSSTAEIYENEGGSCGDDGVRCVMPSPETTYGEAQMIGRLTQTHGWRAITVVTSDVHAPRARLLMSRCVDVPVNVVAVPRTPGGLARLEPALREAGATVASFFLYRC